MREARTWHDRYRDIAYEVDYQVDSDIWHYYLWINLKQLPSEVREQFWLEPKPVQSSKNTPTRYIYEEKNKPPIGNLDWHGGCTFYEKHGHGNDLRVVHVGCDYNHLFDSWQTYSLDSVVQDVKRCIDSLHEQFAIKRQCLRCGKWFVPDGEEKRCLICEGRRK